MCNDEGIPDNQKNVMVWTVDDDVAVCYTDIDEAMGHLRSSVEGLTAGDEICITVKLTMMSQQEVDNMPEYQG